MTSTAPFGSWPSPISADLVAQAGTAVSEPRSDGRYLCWLERRPQENGRTVIVCMEPEGEAFDVTPADFNVRSRAHEYGGGAYAIRDGVLWFVNDDQSIYRQEIGATVVDKIFAREACRFADLLPTRDGALIAVAEQHRGELEPLNSLVRISDTGELSSLAECDDFYASPCLSADESQLAWLSWSHPNMPWDGTQLQLADFDGQRVTAAQTVAGAVDESIFQPGFAPDGRLYFVSDRNDWWNLYRISNGETEAVCDFPAEFGLPQWVFGMRTWGFASNDEIGAVYSQNGTWHAASVCLNTGELATLPLDFSEYNGICALRGREFVAIASSPSQSAAVELIDLQNRRSRRLHQPGTQQVTQSIDAAWLATPQALSFPSEDCALTHALLYRPCNPDWQAGESERPPLIVKLHGGPTAQARTGLDMSIRFWTSRGFAVLDVNYGGSTGYGRKYRQRLNSNWGEVDVDDCVNAALYAASIGAADRDKLAIRGGSAGGFSVLAALTFRKVFKAGASYYGIGDLELLASDTHKFESRYLDTLIGPYPARQSLYRARSPIHKIEQLEAPVIFFQGLEDKVVPPNQAENMVAALRERGRDVEYLSFENEGHGFRQAATTMACLNAELAFYQRVFGLTES